MFIEALAVSQTFAANGTANGVIQVTASAGFYAGAIGYLTDSTGTRNVRCIIVAVPDTTHVQVRIIADDNEQQLKQQIYGAGSNLTAYTTVNSAKLWMPSQLVKVEPTTTPPTALNV